MSSAPLFSDRADAGNQLAQVLLPLVNQEQEARGSKLRPIVYALPRGGVPVAAAVANKLDCPLDIVVSKKITMPRNPELAIGAVTSDGHALWARPRRLDRKQSKLHQAALQEAQAKAQAQLAQLSAALPKIRPEGALALLVDDGIATGMTMAAATKSLLAHTPARIWICSPVAPSALSNWISGWGDRTVILEQPKLFSSVSRFYANFPQVATEEAFLVLQEANKKQQLLGNRQEGTGSKD